MTMQWGQSSVRSRGRGEMMGSHHEYPPCSLDILSLNMHPHPGSSGRDSHLPEEELEAQRS